MMMPIDADQQTIAELKRQLAERTAELKEAHAQQAATAEILAVINSSPGDLAPVFETILEKAHSLCTISHGALLLYDGEKFRAAALRGLLEKVAVPLRRGFVPGPKMPHRRLLDGARFVQITNWAEIDDPIARASLDSGLQTTLLVPFRREGKLLGYIGAARLKAIPFIEKEIALLEGFAAQAVIAIENARLFNETQEALERQTATAEVLQVINSSPGNLAPVFDAILEKAHNLCGAAQGSLQLYDGSKFRAVAARGLSEAFVDRLREGVSLNPNAPGPHLLKGARFVQIPDLGEMDDPMSRTAFELAGIRTVLFIPLRKDGTLLGRISASRSEVKLFTEKEIGLLESFAAQAVIAIENARLFDEVQAKTRDLEESLQFQTASAEVLKVISRSPDRLQPVLDVIVETSRELCRAQASTIFTLRDGRFYFAAFAGTQTEVLQHIKDHPISIDQKGSALARSVRERRTVHIPNTAEDPEFGAGSIIGMGDPRATLTVPLMREGQVIGGITLRQPNVTPFTQRQIEAIETFADQAVIAIENARLFDEVQAKTRDLEESLQQQTATADVLKVISRSAFDLQAVLETLTESAARLCNADSAAIARQGDDGGYYHAARHNFSADWERVSYSVRLGPERGSLVGRVLLARSVVQIADVLSDPEYAYPEQQRAGNYRTLLGVPLLRSGEPIGVLFLCRKTVEPFSDKQIELIQTFADQAVIAIENVRLFDEVQAKTRDLEESLQQQTATSEVLGVIASSPTDVKPVLEAIVESACRLCEANDAYLALRDGDDLVFQAHYGSIPVAWRRRPISRQLPSGRAVVDGKPVHVRDLWASEGDEFPDGRDIARQDGTRTILTVPLMREGEAIGTIILRRTEVQPFSDQQIGLLKTFADQAVIAIGNVRLFDEVQAKTRDIEEALRYQTGSANILRVIASSPTDVKPVLKAIVESACELCAAYDALVRLKDGDGLAFGAHHGPLPVSLASVPITEKSTAGAAVIARKPVHVHDLLAPDGDRFPHARELARMHGERTILSVPMLREGESVGAIVLRRTEVYPFDEKQIALLQTFADQAVIAIENVRLFDEVQAKTRDLEESLQQQTATADVLKVIASSPTDVAPVLQAIAQSACELCDASDASVQLRDGDHLRFAAHHGPIPIEMDRWPINRRWLSGRAVTDKVTLQVEDLLAAEDEFPDGAELARRMGHRTLLSVPMVHDDEAIGTIALRRTEVRPFNDKQIALLQTFAAQAVIAIGNVHLFQEVQAKTRDLEESLQQQTATAEVLEIISSSPSDLAPVFEKMLENATRVCGAEFGSMNLVEDGSVRQAALYNAPVAFAAARANKVSRPPHPESSIGMAIRTRQVVHITDLRTTAAYREHWPNTVELVELGGARTVVVVPLLREDEVIGVITIYRQEVRPFEDKQIELLSNFARQAVIAIENARLLRELRQRTSDLSKSLHDLRTAQDRLIQTEKLASLGQLTAGIAHEIKNPLNFVNNFSALSVELTDELNDLLKQATLADKLRGEVDELTGLLKDNLDKVVQHGKRADSIVKNMLLHSREGSGEHRPADVNALVDESLNLAYHGARAEKPQFNVTLQRDFDPAAGMVEAFPQEITRVLLNLISNGFYAVTKRKADDGSTGFEPLVIASTRGLSDHVEIRIRDNGTGIPPDVKEKMFNPFFTTKPAGEGTGLGLSMSHDIIVKQHGGTIDVETEPGVFTEFTIILPRTNKNKHSFG